MSYPMARPRAGAARTNLATPTVGADGDEHTDDLSHARPRGKGGVDVALEP